MNYNERCGDYKEVYMSESTFEYLTGRPFEEKGMNILEKVKLPDHIEDTESIIRNIDKNLRILCHNLEEIHVELLTIKQQLKKEKK